MSSYFDLKRETDTNIIIVDMQIDYDTCVNLNNRIEICMLSLRMNCKEIHFIVVQVCCLVYHISRYGLTGRDCRVMHRACQ